jgi:predicted porin
LALDPQGGAPMVAYLAGAKYAAGPWTIGIVGEHADYQGNVNMVGLTQSRARAIDTGVSYSVAPGMTVWAEYVWQDIYQGGVNQITGAVGSNANNDIKSQGVLIGDVVNF